MCLLLSVSEKAFFLVSGGDAEGLTFMAISFSESASNACFES